MRRIAYIAVALSVIACPLRPGVAVADEDDGQPAAADAKQPSEGERAEARRLYREGDRLFNLGEYDEAIARFEEGYRLSPEPAFLYNLAQAHRLAGHCDRAYHLYRNFLRLSGDVPHREVIEEQMAEMEACRERLARERAEAEQAERERLAREREEAERAADERARAERERAQAEEAADENARLTAVASPPVSRRVARLERWGGVAAGAAGVVLVGLGGYFAWDAGDASDEVSAVFEDGGTWTPELEEIERRGQTSQLRARAFLAAGGTAAIAGAVFYVLGTRHERRARVVVSSSPSSAEISWVVSF